LLKPYHGVIEDSSVGVAVGVGVGVGVGIGVGVGVGIGVGVGVGIGVGVGVGFIGDKDVMGPVQFNFHERFAQSNSSSS